jgi:hypothetical protein
MTSLQRLETTLKTIMESKKFADAQVVMGQVADLRYQIMHERYLEQYGATDRER